MYVNYRNRFLTEKCRILIYVKCASLSRLNSPTMSHMLFRNGLTHKVIYCRHSMAEAAIFYEGEGPGKLSRPYVIF